jgi:hypothetical protein
MRFLNSIQMCLLTIFYNYEFRRRKISKFKLQFEKKDRGEANSRAQFLKNGISSGFEPLEKSRESSAF